MSANPYTVQIDELSTKLTQLQRDHEDAVNELARWTSQISHYERHDLDKANAELRQAERNVTTLQHLKEKSSADAAALVELAKRLEEDAGLGFDPRRWLSAEREIAKRHLSRVNLELKTMPLKVVESRQEYEAAQTHLEKLKAEIERMRTFDPLESQAAVVALRGTIERLQSCMDELISEIARLQPLRDALDTSLREPLQHLSEDEEERRKLLTRIDSAEHFQRLLDGATSQNDGREKRNIHLRCAQVLGDSDPAAVIMRCRRSLPGVEARILKSQERISAIVRMAMNEVRHIVIDGNNLCYDQANRKLRDPLAALEALVEHLAAKYKVTLIFDPGIIGIAKTRRKDKVSYIKERFPRAAEVHICPSEPDADPTVLGIAEDDPHTYVLSKDKYPDYRAMAAVREKRVLHPNIVASTVFIHELGVRLKFDDAAPDAGAT